MKETQVFFSMMAFVLTFECTSTQIYTFTSHFQFHFHKITRLFMIIITVISDKLYQINFLMKKSVYAIGSYIWSDQMFFTAIEWAWYYGRTQYITITISLFQFPYSGLKKHRMIFTLISSKRSGMFKPQTHSVLKTFWIFSFF